MSRSSSINKTYLLRLTSYARATAHRFSTFSLILASVLLLILGKIDENNLAKVKSYFTDFFSIVLIQLGKPIDSINGGIEEINAFINIYADNKKLLSENTNLYKWKDLALRLKAENIELQKLINAKESLPYQVIAAKVISNSGGSYSKTITINVGNRDGVFVGSAVTNPWGMIGRVVEAGNYSSRVLLTTDINSQIPVFFERSKKRAILVGKNTDLLELKFISKRANLLDKDRLLTSGEGGLLPRGLAVGTYFKNINYDAEIIKILPSRNWDHFNLLNVILYKEDNTIN